MAATRLFLIFVLVAGLLSGCREPGPGSVSGQIKAATPEGGARNIAGAQVILRGARDTYTTVSTAGEESGDQADASYNYRFERVPPGRYTMAVTPPPGSGLQPETDINLEVKADELYPQSVLLLPEGIAKPRPLAPSELNPGETGYINGRGERVVHPAGSGIDMSDLLLMYLLFRNPPGFGYGAPPIIVSSPPTTSGPRYRVEDPPTTTRTGQRVTTRPPAVPGQGATRPGAAPAAGPGPSTSRPPSANGSSPNGSVPKASGGVQAPSKNGSSPNGSSGIRSGDSDAPAQGVTRPGSSGASRPSAPAPSRSGGSSGGSRGSSSSGGGRR